MRARNKRCLQMLSLVAASALPNLMFAATSSWTYGPNGGNWTASWNDVSQWSPNTSFPNSATTAVVFPAVYGAGPTPVITSGPGNVVLNGIGVSTSQIDFYGTGSNAIANPQTVGGYTISGTGSLTLVPDPATNAATISVDSVGLSNNIALPGIATISTSLRTQGNAPLYKTGNGTLVLNGSNSLASGQLQINGGTVRFANTDSFSGLGIVATANNGQLELQNASSGGTIFFGSGSSTLPPDGVIYNSAGNNSWNGTWLLVFGNGQSVGAAPQTTLTLNGDVLDGTSGSISLIKVGGGTFAVGGVGLGHALLINGGTFKTKEGGVHPSDIHGVTIAGGAAPSAKWDLTNNSAVIRSANQAALTADLAAGYASGAWNGNGIASSTAQADSAAHGGQPVSGVGMLTAQELPDWNGTTSHFQGSTLKAGDVALMYTRTGDTNLDGVVDLNVDFANYLAGLTSASPSDWVKPSDVTSGADWSDGDMNYDGVIDINDFPLFVTGYNASGGSLDALQNAINNADSLTSTQKQTMLELAPEPGCGGIILLTITAACMRRRRVALR